MKLCILIGFHYLKEKNSNDLFGTSLDLYNAYTFSVNMCPDRIIMMSDINYNDLKSSLRKLKDKGMKNFDRYIEDNYFLIHNSSDVERVFETEIDAKVDRLFIYFSGHSRGIKGENIVFPDGNLYGSRKFYDLHLSVENHNCQTLIVADSCYYDPDYMYVLSGTSFLPRKIEKYSETNCIFISSSLPGTKSMSSNNGSVFSLVLFNLLDKKINDLFVIKTYLIDKCRRYDQNPEIYSTKINDALLWSWIFGEDVIHSTRDQQYDDRLCLSYNIT